MPALRLHDVARHLRAAGAVASLIAVPGCPVVAQPADVGGARRIDAVAVMSDAVAARVASSVVQVVGSVERADGGIVGIERLAAAGAIVDEAGYILTTARVVAYASRIEVVLASAIGAVSSDAGEPERGAPGTRPPGPGTRSDTTRTVPATLVRLMPDLDLALLRVDAGRLPALRIALTPARPGDAAITVSPMGDGRYAFAVGQVLTDGAPVCDGSPVPYLVTDAAPGAAGAPIVDADGNVIGLAAAMAGDEPGPPRATAALPAPILQMARDRMRDGPADRAVLGLSADAVVRPWAGGATPGEARLVVSAIAPGLPADRAGVLVGDVIVSLDGQAVATMTPITLFLSLYTLSDGQPVVLDIERQGRQLRVTATAVSARQLLAFR